MGRFANIFATLNRCGGSPGLSPIGLDIGSKQIKAVQLAQGADGSWTLRASAQFARNDTDSSNLGDARQAKRIGDVLFRGGFTGNALVLAVPDDKLLTANLELPPRSAEIPLDQIARSEFARSLKLESEPVEFAYWDLPAPARAARATHAMGVGCRHCDCEPMIDAFEAAGFELRTIEVEASALPRACFPASAGLSEITAIVDVGWQSIRLFVMHQGVVSYKRSLGGWGIRRIHDAMTEQLDVRSDEVVEQILHRVSLSDDLPSATIDAKPAPESTARGSEEVRYLLRSHFDAVAAEITTSLSYTSHQYPDAAISRVLLCGGGAALRGLADYLGKRLNIDTASVTAGQLVKVDNEAIRQDTSFTLAIGLAQNSEAIS